MYSESVLSIRGLCKTFGEGPKERVYALDGVDFDVDEGELVTVVGPSGCGKTTLLRSIAGFEAPNSGTISVAGAQMVGSSGRVMPAHQRGIGLVPQEGSLFPHLSVAQNVGFGLPQMSRRKRKARISEVLDLVGLAEFGRRRPHELSGGQQQRVALARAIAPSPRVILLDEPFSALDEYLRETLRRQVREILRRLGTTAVLVTHDQEEALALGDRVAVMRAGRVVQTGTPRETYYQPADLDLARFLGEAVVIDGDIISPGCEAICDSTACRAAVSCAFGDLPVSAQHGGEGRCSVLVRPEDIQVFREAADGTAHESGLVGTIREHTFYGHDGLLRVSVPQLEEAVSVRVLGNQQYRIGEPVRLVVDRHVCTYSS